MLEVLNFLTLRERLALPDLRHHSGYDLVINL